jgi:CheY-like chemotaxis protein
MKRITMCDDEIHILEGLKHLLRGPDRIIETASCGEEALRKIEANLPDLLVIDIMMPEMNGLEVVARLREMPATAELPVIILTAKGQAQDTGMAQEMWRAKVMAKPFEPSTLKEMVKSVLEKTPCLLQNSIS